MVRCFECSPHQPKAQAVLCCAKGEVLHRVVAGSVPSGSELGVEADRDSCQRQRSHDELLKIARAEHVVVEDILNALESVLGKE